jgi:hypothetical protein
MRAVGDRSLCVMEIDERGVGVAANLAVALTAGRRRVALIDAGEDPAAMVPEDLAEGVTVHAAPLDGTEEVAREMIERLLGEADTVIVRAPGIDRSPVGLTWAGVVDGTLFVASTDRTVRSDLSAAVESLRLVHGRLLGTVLGSGSPYLGRR